MFGVIVTLALIFAFLVTVGVLLARIEGHAGSSDVVDRDAQRLRAELDAISHHR
ncbi:hypothetical protein IU433_26845 [Nocardia puris]|uniref:hypothetical protein n=1 Tax=Nocardia puris TaxID=208602 RepID=UPI001893E0D4|nr:hypothetical protein [Nocardia puris]MBF6213010.1 hypothetical protein [Nocardia puris]MBF6368001.1 hypothetical protein [Nocardia puris]MBF6462634.1 hypothetical protein [Nocardia puris]